MSNYTPSFYSYAEFVHQAVNRTKISRASEYSRKTNDFNFFQTNSFEQAEDYATNGWDAGLEQFKIEDGVLSSGTTHLNPSVSGCIPHVQNFINGFPEQMYALYDEREYNLPTLDIVVTASYTAGINGKDAFKFSQSVIKYINKMASTHNIRLTAIFPVNLEAGNQVACITVKKFDENLVLNNVAFAFHPSFFRRIWFSVLEGKEFWESGYGRSIGDVKMNLDEILQGNKADKVVYFKSLQQVKSYTFEPDNIEEHIY
jgi:hypothetical protein